MKKTKNLASIILVALVLFTAQSSRAQMPTINNTSALVTPSGVVTATTQINTVGNAFTLVLKWTTDLQTNWNTGTPCDSVMVYYANPGVGATYYTISTPQLPTGKYSLQIMGLIPNVANLSGVTQVTVFNTTGLWENNYPKISVYPNPATEIINIGYGGLNTRLDILNHLGALVYQGPGGKININNLNTGLYTFILKEGNEVKTGQFVKK